MLKSTPSSGEGIRILPQEIKSLQKGYKYELYPNKEQKEYLEKIFGSCRRVYNDLLAIQIKKYEEAVANSTKPTFPSLQNLSAILTS
jgi:transposase